MNNLQAKKEELSKVIEEFKATQDKYRLLKYNKEQLIELVLTIHKAHKNKAFKTKACQKDFIELHEMCKTTIGQIVTELSPLEKEFIQLKKQKDQLYKDYEKAKSEELAFQKKMQNALKNPKNIKTHEQTINLGDQLPKRFDLISESGFKILSLPFKRRQDFLIDLALSGKELTMIFHLENGETIDHKIFMPSTKGILHYKIYFELRYGDGEQEFPIFVNGYCLDNSGEGGTHKYWDKELLEHVSEETGAHVGEMMFLDGDADGDIFETHPSEHVNGVGSVPTGFYSPNMDPKIRKEKGRIEAKEKAKVIISRLDRNQDNKIIQRIQVYTHSRGAAFAEGFLEELIKIFTTQYSDQFLDPTNIIDFVLHFDPNQSGSITVTEHKHKTMSLSHHGSILGDKNMKGKVTNIETSVMPLISHPNHTFADETKELLDQINTNVINGEEIDEHLDGLLHDQVSYSSEEENIEKAKKD